MLTTQLLVVIEMPLKLKLLRLSEFLLWPIIQTKTRITANSLSALSFSLRLVKHTKFFQLQNLRKFMINMDKNSWKTEFQRKKLDSEVDINSKATVSRFSKGSSEPRIHLPLLLTKRVIKLELSKLEETHLWEPCPRNSKIWQLRLNALLKNFTTDAEKKSHLKEWLSKAMENLNSWPLARKLFKLNQAWVLEQFLLSQEKVTKDQIKDNPISSLTSLKSHIQLSKDKVTI